MVKRCPPHADPVPLAQHGLRWAPTSPCSHDRHQAAFTTHCLPRSAAGLASPVGGGGEPGTGRRAAQGAPGPA